MKDYYSKYLKYKQKYITAKYIGGMDPTNMSPEKQAADLAKMSPADQAAAPVVMSPEQKAAVLKEMSEDQFNNMVPKLRVGREQDIAAVLEKIPPAKALVVLAGMSNVQQTNVLTAMQEKQAAEVLALMSSSQEGDVLRQMSRGKKKNKLVELVKQERQQKKMKDALNKISLTNQMSPMHDAVKNWKSAADDSSPPPKQKDPESDAALEPKSSADQIKALEAMSSDERVETLMKMEKAKAVEKLNAMSQAKAVETLMEMSLEHKDAMLQAMSSKQSAVLAEGFDKLIKEIKNILIKVVELAKKESERAAAVEAAKNEEQQLSSITDKTKLINALINAAAEVVYQANVAKGAQSLADKKTMSGNSTLAEIFADKVYNLSKTENKKKKIIAADEAWYYLTTKKTEEAVIEVIEVIEAAVSLKEEEFQTNEMHLYVLREIFNMVKNKILKEAKDALMQMEEQSKIEAALKEISPEIKVEILMITDKSDMKKALEIISPNMNLEELVEVVVAKELSVIKMIPKDVLSKHFEKLEGALNKKQIEEQKKIDIIKEISSALNSEKLDTAEQNIYTKYNTLVQLVSNMQCDGGNFIFIRTQEDLDYVKSLLTKEKQLIPVINDDNMFEQLREKDMAPISLDTLKKILSNNILNDDKEFNIHTKNIDFLNNLLEQDTDLTKNNRYNLLEYPAKLPIFGETGPATGAPVDTPLKILRDGEFTSANLEELANILNNTNNDKYDPLLQEKLSKAGGKSEFIIKQLASVSTNNLKKLLKLNSLKTLGFSVVEELLEDYNNNQSRSPKKIEQIVVVNATAVKYRANVVKDAANTLKIAASDLLQEETTKKNNVVKEQFYENKAVKLLEELEKNVQNIKELENGAVKLVEELEKEVLIKQVKDLHEKIQIEKNQVEEANNKVNMLSQWMIWRYFPIS